MLIPEDEFLLHQAPLTFSQTVTSDHRFYDRMWFTMGDPAGAAGLGVGMGLYKNMNVADGFALLALPDRQVNVRVSRPLRPAIEAAVGGLRIEILEPLKALRLSLADEHEFSFDIEWRGTTPIMEEGIWYGTHKVANERQVIDVRRYQQVGKVNGWIKRGGERIDVVDWFGGRDHSWGVRAGVGGFEPYNGERTLSASGMLMAWVIFDCGEFSGTLVHTVDGHGEGPPPNGVVNFADGRPARNIVAATLDPSFPADSRYFDHLAIDFVTDDRAQWRLEATPTGPTIIVKGGGYNAGWNDGKGLGVYRDNLTESDVWLPTSNPHIHKNEAGLEILHSQLAQFANVTVNGVAGHGDCTVIALGDLPGLTALPLDEHR